MSNGYLFSPAFLGSISTSNRIVMAPLTRARADDLDGVPSEPMARYYAQRATAGVIISEAINVSPQGRGHSGTPGLYAEDQIEAWRDITGAVHNAGGVMVAQLLHSGAASHAALHGSRLPVAPSAVAIDAQVWLTDPDTGMGRHVRSSKPRPLHRDEIASIVEDYRLAALNAVVAGFDGVEIHAAYGSLLDQFLSRGSNTRSDDYGAQASDRYRLLIEVVTAVADAVGHPRVGVRLSPMVTMIRSGDDDIVLTTLAAVHKLDALELGFIHLAEADDEVTPANVAAFRQALRLMFKGSIIVVGQFDRQRALELLKTGLVDFIAFGRAFIGNPDLVRRFRDDLLLTDFDPTTVLGGDEKGLTDYPDFDTWLGKLRTMMLN